MNLIDLWASLKSQTRAVATATVATSATDEKEMPRNEASVAKVASVAVANHEDMPPETFMQWEVFTSNRGTVKVICSEPMTEKEVCWFPGAVSAVPLLEE
ncbi:hypothetical protein NB640_08420 [Oxalobacter vibrioformis]|uniref:Uncharacterized protein n=1 Tax=Oxalobacter vibrioformis TaxID=933080 RepID=A0A9E9LV45_9BURK|nr:hypothetical protein [Oxalobacter vibrioformis]WAW09287.1 hypothetical protein NB640_08420 [Oxalobacter vibrioformis]